MRTLTLDEIQAQVFALFPQGKYAEVADLLTQTADVFLPDASFTYYNWQMCAAALQGQSERALRFFREALDAGCWYSERSLREDTDLTTLQGLPEFERLVAISEQRSAVEQAQATSKLLVRTPDNVLAPYPWLIALHGNMSSLDAPTAVNPWRPALSLGWLLAAAQSSQIRGEDRYVWDDRGWAMREILQHAETVCKQYAGDPARGVIGGFSLGGGMALGVGLMGILPIKQIIAVAPWLSASDMTAIEASLVENRPDGLQVFIVVSEYDKDCYKASRALSALLKKYGIVHELTVTHELGHNFPPGFTDMLTRQLGYV